MDPIKSRKVHGQEVCSVMEAARVLGVSRVTVHQYLTDKKLDCIVMPVTGYRQPLVRSVRRLLQRSERAQKKARAKA